MNLFLIILIIIAKPSPSKGPTALPMKPSIEMIKESRYQTGILR